MTKTNSRNTSANIPTYASILTDTNKDFSEPTSLYDEWRKWTDELMEEYL